MELACHMECFVNHTIVWWSFTVWPHKQSGELGSYSERTSNYDIHVIYRTLHGKPILGNYPFYPTDCFCFLNSNNVKKVLFFFSSAFYINWYFFYIYKTWSIQLVHVLQLFWENLYLGISCILVTCLLNVILSLCAFGCHGNWGLLKDLIMK